MPEPQDAQTAIPVSKDGPFTTRGGVFLGLFRLSYSVPKDDAVYLNQKLRVGVHQQVRLFPDILHVRRPMVDFVLYDTHNKDIVKLLSRY
jgi:hypothetical protein